jgi:hypothetical protein
VTGTRPSRLTPTGGGTADEAVPPPIPLALVEEACRALSKAVRARMLYLPNNPNYQRAGELFAAAFVPFWEHDDSCTLVVGEHHIGYAGHVVYRDDPQGGEQLAWLLFKDGLRELTVLPGFEGECERLLDIMVRARKTLPDEDDLLTLLWEGDFLSLRYRFVDVTLDGLEVADYMAPEPPVRVVDAWGTDTPAGWLGTGLDGGVAGDGDGVGASGGEGTGTGTGGVSGVVNLADFDQTLYFLDEREVDYLRQAITQEYDRDTRRGLVATLLDIFEQQTDGLVREELCGLVEGYMLSLLTGAHFRTVAYLLREVQQSVGRARDLDPAHRDRLARLSDRLSDPTTLAQMLQALDDAPELPSVADLTELFGTLRPQALRTVFAWLGRLSKAALRQALEEAAGALAAQHTGELVRLIAADDRAVAIEAMRRSGALRTAAAVTPLTKALAAPDAELRFAAVSALAEIGTPGALQAAERSVEDPERDVRVAALRAIGTRAYRAALPRLEALVKGKVLRERDLTEKMATFEAFGAIAGDGGVPVLDGLLNGKGFLGRREDPELRACAAVALGRIGTPAATAALRKAAQDLKDEAVVRSAVNRALRGGAAE